jgi:hypothetical protein
MRSDAGRHREMFYRSPEMRRSMAWMRAMSSSTKNGGE